MVRDCALPRRDDDLSRLKRGIRRTVVEGDRFRRDKSSSLRGSAQSRTTQGKLRDTATATSTKLAP